MTPAEEHEFVTLVVPALVQKTEIEARCAYRASAIMLPAELGPGVESCFGLPVVRGDRVALIYEPPQ